MAKRRGNGEGSITKRKDGRWQASAKVGYNSETDKPKYAYFYGKTRKEVQEKLSEALGKVQSGTYREPTKLILAEWLTTWLNDYMKPSIRPTTWESYKTQVDKHIIPTLGHLKLAQLQTSNLQKLYNEKLQRGRADGKPGGLSPRSVKYIHVVLHGALEQARKEGMITINPANAVKLPNERKKEMQTLDTAGIAKFIELIKDKRLYPAYMLELATGLRRGELLALRWKDLVIPDKEAKDQTGSVTVNQNIVRVKSGLVFQEPKTNFSRRTVSIPANITKELRIHKKKQEWEKESMGCAYQENDLVFCTQEGKPIDPRAFTRGFERIISELEKEGFPRITFHGLRHTFATLSLQEGVSPRTIQETLGHHSAAFTMSVYSHVTEKMKKEATDKIGNLLASCQSE